MTACQSRVNLLEWLEEPVPILGLDSDPFIPHAGLQRAISDLTFDAHLATLTELQSFHLFW